MQIITTCPAIPIRFDSNLLSTPTFGYTAENLKSIGDWLLKKIESAEFRKFPATISKLKQQHKKFVELYERAKTHEEQNKTKKHIKTQWLGYRPKMANQNDQRLFERLDNRRKTSEHDRRNNNIQSI